MDSEIRAVLLSDVHLNLKPKPELTAALAALLLRHPGARLIFVGDWFELSSVDTEFPAQALAQLAAFNSDSVRLLRQYVADGGRIDWVIGNHDAGVTSLGASVGAILDLPVTVHPWFYREGGVHIEHGHVYDRDNAPVHPWRAWAAHEEPIGTALMRRFIARYEIPEFAHAHQTTPLAGLMRAFELLGRRVPGLVLAYLYTATSLCLDAHRVRRVREVSTFDAAPFANCGVPEDEVLAYAAALVALCAVPTHAAVGTTFMRLYLDQILAALLIGAGTIACLSGAALPALAGLGLGGGYLVRNKGTRGVSRYPGPEQALREVSQVLASQLGVSAVIMGHSHVPEQSGVYVNLGAFGYPEHGQGRSYATLHQDGRVVLRRLEPDV